MIHRRRMLLTIVLVLVVAACGGGSDDGDRPATTAASNGDSGDDVITIGGDLDLPEYFPADFYLPDGITIKSSTDGADAMSLTGTFEDGDIESIQADAIAGLQAAGYELLSNESEIAAFVKNGVGRVRVRTSEFLGSLTLNIDIDKWTDAQLDELRALFVEEITVTGSATATFGGESLGADGECILAGASRMFFADDVSITIQIDETRDPVYVYADITTPEGTVWSLDETVTPSYESSPQRLVASGEMYDFTGDAANVDFRIEATCDT